jgi:hypothetical protein
MFDGIPSLSTIGEEVITFQPEAHQQDNTSQENAALLDHQYDVEFGDLLLQTLNNLLVK